MAIWNTLLGNGEEAALEQAADDHTLQLKHMEARGYIGEMVTEGPVEMTINDPKDLCGQGAFTIDGHFGQPVAALDGVQGKLYAAFQTAATDTSIGPVTMTSVYSVGLDESSNQLRQNSTQILQCDPEF